MTKSKLRAEFIIVIIFSVLFIGIVVLQQQKNELRPVLVVSSLDNGKTEIILLTLNFNDSSDWYDEAGLETSVFVPAFDFIKESSGSKMIVEIVDQIAYTTKDNESYYGLDDKDFADINLLDLYDEIKHNLQKDKLLLVVHPGISQTLRISNSSGIYDQYLGKIKGYPDGTIFLSRYSPFSMLVHEIGHFWGLPDLYNKNQIGKYGIMGSGGWHSYNETTGTHGIDGTDPIDFSSWSKIKLGWVDYWNGTAVKKSTYSVDDIIVVQNFLFQYVDRGLVNAGIVVLSDKFQDTEFIDLLKEGNSQKYLLRDGKTILVRFKGNDIIISYSTIKNLDFSFDTLFYRASQISLLLLVAYIVRRFTELVNR